MEGDKRDITKEISGKIIENPEKTVMTFMGIGGKMGGVIGVGVGAVFGGLIVVVASSIGKN